MHTLKQFRLALAFLMVVGLLLGSGSCRQREQAQEEQSEEASDPERNLTFNNITLEQSNDEGQVVWRMTADRAIYSQDRQVAEIENPSGEFLRDNEPTLKVQAESGEVINDGEQILLRGDVVATDVETGAVLRGDELEWRTEQDLVIIRNNVVATHPDFKLAADEARAAISEERVEAIGNVVAVSNEDKIQLAAERLVWWLAEERVVSDRPIQLQQREGQRVVAEAEGDRAEFNMASEVAILQQNAVIVLQDPPLRVTGNSLQWNLADGTVVADQPFSAFHRTEQTTLSANRGTGDLDTQVFRFNENVSVTAQQNQARLTSNTLVWTIPTQEIVAEGDVVYRQVDPVFNLRGPLAEGKLENQTIVVSGGRVVTEIIPETAN